MIRDVTRASKVIQKWFRVYNENTRKPRIQREKEAVATVFIQKFLRGYQARRLTLKAKAEIKINALYDEWHRIDIIMKSNLQRRIRRAWLAYKERKAEKKRKAAEAAAAKKGKYGGRRKVPAKAPSRPSAPAAATTPAKPPPAK